MPLVRVPFFADPVERTEDEIAELRNLGLLVDDPAPAAPAPKTPAPPSPADSSKETK